MARTSEQRGLVPIVSLAQSAYASAPLGSDNGRGEGIVFVKYVFFFFNFMLLFYISILLSEFPSKSAFHRKSRDVAYHLHFIFYVNKDHIFIIVDIKRYSD